MPATIEQSLSRRYFLRSFNTLLLVVSFCTLNTPIQYQFAYRKNLGTTDALLSTSHKSQQALDRGHEARVVQLDFSAAFDRVNYAGLLRKLQSFGVGGPVLSILTQYLTDRTHCVCFDNCYSDWCSVHSGVPQVVYWDSCCSTSTLLIYYKALAILSTDMQMI